MPPQILLASYRNMSCYFIVSVPSYFRVCSANNIKNLAGYSDPYSRIFCFITFEVTMEKIAFK